MIKKLSITFLLAVTATTCFAQQNRIPFEGYNVAEGLPEEYVYSPIQDDKGYYLKTQREIFGSRLPRRILGGLF